MGIGPFIALGMIGAAMVCSDNEETKTQDNRSFEDILERERAKRERERRYKQKIANEFEESRKKVLESNDLYNEAKKTGFILTVDNKYVGGMYVSYMHGLKEDIRISVISKHELNSENRETISNALWFLVMTEKKTRISVRDFEYAIKVGGYSDFPYEIKDVNYKNNYLQLQCT